VVSGEEEEESREAGGDIGVVNGICKAK